MALSHEEIKKLWFDYLNEWNSLKYSADRIRKIDPSQWSNYQANIIYEFSKMENKIKKCPSQFYKEWKKSKK